jgi:hypothetical protein
MQSRRNLPHRQNKLRKTQVSIHTHAIKEKAYIATAECEGQSMSIHLIFSHMSKRSPRVRLFEPCERLLHADYNHALPERRPSQTVQHKSPNHPFPPAYSPPPTHPGCSFRSYVDQRDDPMMSVRNSYLSVELLRGVRICSLRRPQSTTE